MEQHDLERLLVSVFERLDIPYFITGSVATIFYGEPRFTNDIDVVADVKPEHIPALLAAFSRDDFYLSEDAIKHALHYRTEFNILDPNSGLKVDVMIPKQTDHDRARFARRVKVKSAPDLEAYLSSPEDVIIKKMESYKEGGSHKHLRDIAGVLKIMGEQIDRAYIADWAGRIGLEEIWQEILARK